MAANESLCLVCNKPGRHFVPPSMGTVGYHRCATPAASAERLQEGQPPRAA